MSITCAIHQHLTKTLAQNVFLCSQQTFQIPQNQSLIVLLASAVLILIDREVLYSHDTTENIASTELHLVVEKA